jgi:hypothetical protein
MPSFIITLPKEKEKLYRKIANFIFILNGTLLASTLVAVRLSKLQQAIALISLFLIITTLITTLVKSKKCTIESFFLLSHLTSIIYWAMLGIWWVSITMVVLIVLYYISIRKLSVAINANQILYPSWPIRKINWRDLNNIILKDGLLTIDFKDDKIIQHIIDEKETAVDEKEFNDFCREKLNKKKPDQTSADKWGALDGFGEILSSID